MRSRKTEGMARCIFPAARRIGKPPFYQQNAPRDVPKSVRSALVPSSDGKSRRIIGGDLPTLLYGVQLGAVDVNPWLSRVGSLGAADFAVLDLDPTPQASFTRVVKVARQIVESLTRGRYRAAIKTSGSRGVHIFVPMPPRTSYAQAQDFARTVATAVAEESPKDATIERSVAKRPRGTVYIDFLQNAEGKSVAAAFSLRARDGAPVSMPIAVSELTDSLRIDDFTIVKSAAQSARRGKQWAALARYRGPTKA
jgi:bifunctional non-homologous end joining protein LigD